MSIEHATRPRIQIKTEKSNGESIFVEMHAVKTKLNMRKEGDNGKTFWKSYNNQKNNPPPRIHWCFADQQKIIYLMMFIPYTCTKHRQEKIK